MVYVEWMIVGGVMDLFNFYFFGIVSDYAWSQPQNFGTKALFVVDFLYLIMLEMPSSWIFFQL